MFVRLDSVGIFALIAGSYTPLTWNLMEGPWRAWTLTAVWGTALTAIVLIVSGHRFSPALGTFVYLGIGWGVLVCYAQIARVVPHRQLMLVVLGGSFYSLGAVLNLLGWPVLWPGSFGVHDLFHLFVIAGSLAHYWFVLKVIVPFGRGHNHCKQRADDSRRVETALRSRMEPLESIDRGPSRGASGEYRDTHRPDPGGFATD